MQQEECNALFSQSISLPALYVLTSAIITHANITSGGATAYHGSWLVLYLESYIDMESLIFAIGVMIMLNGHSNICI